MSQMQMKIFVVFSKVQSYSSAVSREYRCHGEDVHKASGVRAKSQQCFNIKIVLNYWGLLVQKVTQSWGNSHCFSLAHSNSLSPASASVTATLVVVTWVSSIRSEGSWATGVVNSSEELMGSSVEKQKQNQFPAIRKHCCCMFNCSFYHQNQSLQES